MENWKRRSEMWLKNRKMRRQWAKDIHSLRLDLCSFASASCSKNEKKTCRKSPWFFQERHGNLWAYAFSSLNYISTQPEKKPQANKSSSSCSRILKEELRVMDLSLTAHMLYV
ncbi:hypothetical protein Ddye_016882 [Dipteronia dyeriana]|uniref:Uncharacterized protein n=1 Tax=Dipteronia dyeriana TaxID=168575 RepID=A0AAD9U883_9ROSI|nr:hypothetical protein Ddye_016882 [Dipteronia dyeriana]